MKILFGSLQSLPYHSEWLWMCAYLFICLFIEKQKKQKQSCSS